MRSAKRTTFAPVSRSEAGLGQADLTAMETRKNTPNFKRVHSFGGRIRASLFIRNCQLQANPCSAGGCDGFLQGRLCSCNRHGFGTTDSCWMVGLCTIPRASWQFLGRGNHFTLTRRVGGFRGSPPQQIMMAFECV